MNGGTHVAVILLKNILIVAQYLYKFYLWLKVKIYPNILTLLYI